MRSSNEHRYSIGYIMLGSFPLAEAKLYRNQNAL